VSTGGASSGRVGWLPHVDHMDRAASAMEDPVSRRRAETRNQSARIERERRLHETPRVARGSIDRELRMRIQHWTVLFVVALVTAVVAGACGGGGGDDPGLTGAGTGANDGQGGSLFGTGGSTHESLELDPPEATIVVDNGSSMPVSFKALKGSVEVHPTTWYVDFRTISDVDVQGVV